MTPFCNCKYAPAAMHPGRCCVFIFATFHENYLLAHLHAPGAKKSTYVMFVRGGLILLIEAVLPTAINLYIYILPVGRGRCAHRRRRAAFCAHHRLPAPLPGVCIGGVSWRSACWPMSFCSPGGRPQEVRWIRPPEVAEAWAEGSTALAIGVKEKERRARARMSSAGRCPAATASCAWLRG